MVACAIQGKTFVQIHYFQFKTINVSLIRQIIFEQFDNTFEREKKFHQTNFNPELIIFI